MKGNIKFYVPLVMTFIAACLTGVQDALTDSNITAQEWVQVVILGVMAFNVWATANLPGYERMKTFVAATITTLQVLFTGVIGGVSMAEWINLILTFVGALGVVVSTQRLTTVVNGTTITPDGNRA